MKKLTVMVSIYNSGEWLENRIQNLLDSTIRSEIEIWCLNANSPDERDDSIPRKFSVRYEKLPNRISVYAAWNYIIKNSNSQYITNANTDDLVAPNAYERLTSELDRSSEIGFVYPSWLCTSTPNQRWSQLINTDAGGLPGTYNGNVEISGVGHFPLWRRSLHHKLGLFDEHLKTLADADWWARCYHVGKTKFRWINEFLACYLWRDGQNLWHRENTPEEWAIYHQKLQRYKKNDPCQLE